MTLRFMPMAIYDKRRRYGSHLAESYFSVDAFGSFQGDPLCNDVFIFDIDSEFIGLLLLDGSKISLNRVDLNNSSCIPVYLFAIYR